MITRLSVCLPLLLTLLTACADLKSAGQKVGHTTRDVTRDVGHATRDAAKAVGHVTRDTTQKIGHTLRDTANGSSEE